MSERIAYNCPKIDGFAVCEAEAIPLEEQCQWDGGVYVQTDEYVEGDDGFVRIAAGKCSAKERAIADKSPSERTEFCARVLNYARAAKISRGDKAVFKDAAMIVLVEGDRERTSLDVIFANKTSKQILGWTVRLLDCTRGANLSAEDKETLRQIAAVVLKYSGHY